MFANLLSACAAILLTLALARVGAVPLTAQEKADTLARHNFYRCGVSPPAASMPRMVWDTNLEAVAQQYVDTCPTGHNSDRSKQYNQLTGTNTYVGENMAWGYSTIVKSIDGYGGENKYYTYSSNSCQSGQQCGHYTQLVWADTVRVGCARVTGTCPSWGDKIYVCDYAPGGNYVGSKPYVSSASCVANDACAAINSAPCQASTVATTSIPPTAPTTTKAPTTTTKAPTTTTKAPTTTTKAPTKAPTTTTKAPTTTTKKVKTKTTTAKTTTAPASAYCPISSALHKLKCIDGSSCDVSTQGWGCCASHGGRKKCPPEKPIMCSNKTCDGGISYCCQATSETPHCTPLPLSQCP